MDPIITGKLLNDTARYVERGIIKEQRILRSLSERQQNSDQKIQSRLSVDNWEVDETLSMCAPKNKVMFHRNWDWKPKGEKSTLSLGSISMIDKLSNLKWSRGSMADAEIHIIYLPHLPVENYRKYHLNLKLNFDGADDDDDKLIASAEFPVSLHTHVIFYPGHSFSLKYGSLYPWSIQMTTDAPINPNYLIADVFVQFKAFNVPLSKYSEKKGASIISLVPIEECPTGFTLTRPRIGDWKIKGIKFGTSNNKDLKIVQILQEIKVDIEALQNLGILGKVIDKLKREKVLNMENVTSRNLKICSEILGITKTI